MVNFSLNPGSLMGIILAFAGVGLYLLRSFRPNLARDYDVFFAAVALLCGGIFFFQSWRLDPLLQFGVFLLTGSSLFFAYDSIRLRGIATEQAKRSTPLVDEDRPVSRVYRYDSQFEPEPDYGYDYFQQDRQPPARRIRGSEDSINPDYRAGYSDTGSGYEGGYDRERSSASRSRRPRRPNNAESYPTNAYDDSGYPDQAGYSEQNRSESRNSSRRRPRKAKSDNYQDSYTAPSSYETPEAAGYSSSDYRSPEPGASGYADPAYGNPGYDNPDTGAGYSSYESSEYRSAGTSSYAPPEGDRPSRRSRRRPPTSRPPVTEAGSPYVDYRPLQPNEPGMESDNSAHFDD